MSASRRPGRHGLLQGFISACVIALAVGVSCLLLLVEMRVGLARMAAGAGDPLRLSHQLAVAACWQGVLVLVIACTLDVILRRVCRRPEALVAQAAPAVAEMLPPEPLARPVDEQSLASREIGAGVAAASRETREVFQAIVEVRNRISQIVDVSAAMHEAAAGLRSYAMRPNGADGAGARRQAAA